MDISSGKREKKRFQCCLKPNFPDQLLYLGAIQGHSGSIVDPALQDTVLLPEGLPSTCITSERKRIEVNSE